MIEDYLRPLYQKVCVNPLFKIIDRYTNWAPTHITVVAVFLGVMAAVMIMLKLFWFGVVLLLLSGYCDSLDGSYARYKNVSSSFGAVLDIVGDRVVETVVIIALYTLAPHARATVTIFMFASILLCVTSFLVVGIFMDNESNRSFHYSRGIMERPEAFLFFIAMILLPQYFTIIAWVFVILVLLTAFIRVYQFTQHHR